MRKLIVSIISLILFVGASAGTYPFAHLYKDLPFDMPVVALPTIADNQVSIVDFGGVGDGIAKNTEAFASAIADLSKKGGGRLIVPFGVWYTGPIELKSNIELHLEQGAVISFSKDKSDYPIIDAVFEGLDTKRTMSPLWAKGAKNIAVTGRGTLDGNGQVWRFVKKGKMTAAQWSALIKSGGVLNDKKDEWYPSPSFKKGSELSTMNVPDKKLTDEQWVEIKDYLRPVMVSLMGCENILLEGVTFQNSPAWNIHPLMCKNLIVNNLSVRNPWYSQNGDGIDVESCENVIIANSTFDVGDDAVCIKSGKDADGRRRGIATQNVIVDNVIVFHAHGGFVVGSEMSGGVKNISVTNCQFLGTDVGLRFKSNRGRGGVVENIYISKISMIDIPTEPLLFDLFYGGKSALEDLEQATEADFRQIKAMAVDETTPQFKNIYINDVICRGARRAMLFNGLPEMPLLNVHLNNCTIYSTLGAEINHSQGVELKNVTIYNTQGAALSLVDVGNVVITDFEANTKNGAAMSVSGSGNSSITVTSGNITLKNSTITPEAIKTVKFNK